MASDNVIDALLVIPPPSPSETNPPLGPMILARAADRRGINVEILDLNIEYLRRFRGMTGVRQTGALGDHGKNRVLLAEAAELFFASTGLRTDDALHLPDTADARAGMHFGFETLQQATAQAAVPGAPWGNWLEDLLLDRFSEIPPLVIGISVMGPSQVFLALVVARLVKRRWPLSITVLGGSHATLLASEIAADPRYCEFFDRVLPGHSEEEFADLVVQVRDGRRPAMGLAPASPPGRVFDYHPLVTLDQLAPYDPAALTMPVQFTRGCSYARCTYCTYPVVEPLATGLDAPRAAAAIGAVMAEHGVTRFSVKDSLFSVPMMLDLAGALEAAGTRVHWSATTKITRSLMAHAPRLAAAGLSTLEFGVETIHRQGQRIFDKVTDVGMAAEVLSACAESGITAVINLIFGLPGETLEQADRQLEWFETQRRAAPGMIDGSLNMLEIVRGSPLAVRPPPEVELRGIAPWAYCYDWNAPTWRPRFADHIRDLELRPHELTGPPAAP